MKQYFIGFFTGACLIASAVMFMGATDKNLGEITVSSINVVDEDGKTVVVITGDEYGGKLGIYYSNGKPAVGLWSHKSGGRLSIFDTNHEPVVHLLVSEYGGQLSTHSSNGKPAIGLSTTENGGILETYNVHAVRTGYFGTNLDKDGLAVLYDRYGDIGWTELGKK